MNRAALIIARRAGKPFFRGWLPPCAVMLLSIACTAYCFAQSASNQSNEFTLQQFRSLVEARLAESSKVSGKSRDKTPAPDLRPAEELFSRLLAVQARGAAAHQSADRLAGWRRAIETRYQTQNAPQLDLEIARFAEARIAAESARIEAQQKQLVEQANSLLGRPPAAPFTALPMRSSEDSLTAAEKQNKDLLAQGEELLSKMFKSYQFGGISVTSLMEYENGLYEIEVEYRLQVARDAVKGPPAAPTR
jgi:hypothetical protein